MRCQMRGALRVVWLWLGRTTDIAQLYPLTLSCFVQIRSRCLEKCVSRCPSSNLPCSISQLILVCSLLGLLKPLLIENARTSCLVVSGLVMTPPGACHSCQRPSLGRELSPFWVTHGLNVTHEKMQPIPGTRYHFHMPLVWTGCPSSSDVPGPAFPEGAYAA